LVFRRGFVYTKNYQKQGARPRSILDGARFGVTRSGRRDAEAALGIPGIFDFPKPVQLIKYLVGIGGPDNARVLDFFAGSGTTAQAVAELNAADGGTRTVQLIQLPEPTAPRSAAFQAGYTTIADSCWARIQAAGLDAQRVDVPAGELDKYAQLFLAELVFLAGSGFYRMSFFHIRWASRNGEKVENFIG